MAELSFMEKNKLEKLLDMKGGYVLNFTNRTFQEFVLDSTGKDIYESTYEAEGSSKASRLRAFFKVESNEVVAKLLSDLLRLYEEENSGVTSDNRYADCLRIVERLAQISTDDVQVPTLQARVSVGAQTEVAELVNALPGKNQDSSIVETWPTSTNEKRQNIFVVHGRNIEARDALFRFLRSLGLKPLEWSHAVHLTKKTSPYIGEVLDAAFDQAQAVVVLMTPDDEARLHAVYRNENDAHYESRFCGQARANVLFEAGMAMGRNAARTLLVELGTLRPFSDIGGRHVVRLDNSSASRQQLAQRLMTAGCAVDMRGTDWHREGDFNLGFPVPSTDEAVEAGRKIDLLNKEASIDLNLIFTLLHSLVDYSDFYLSHEVPKPMMKNAQDRFLPQREQVMAFLNNTHGNSGCDGVAFTTSGIYWRNDHTEEPCALLWKQLAEVNIKGSDRYDEVRIGSEYINLTASDVQAPHLAKVLRAIASNIHD